MFVSICTQSCFWMWNDGTKFDFDNWHKKMNMDDEMEKTECCLKINYGCNITHTHTNTNFWYSTFFNISSLRKYLWSINHLCYETECSCFNPKFDYVRNQTKSNQTMTFDSVNSLKHIWYSCHLPGFRNETKYSCLTMLTTVQKL